jgi:hypothetical protein
VKLDSDERALAEALRAATANMSLEMGTVVVTWLQTSRWQRKIISRRAEAVEQKEFVPYGIPTNVK